MAGTKISDATLTTPVTTDMIAFERVADATARHMTVAALFDRAIVINESGADVDTRIEAAGQANALFVQGSDGFVGIGKVPTVRFDVAGDVAISGAAVFNEAGADRDYRFEAVGETHALFIQGSDGFVGLGTVPDARLVVYDTAGDKVITKFGKDTDNRLTIYQYDTGVYYSIYSRIGGVTSDINIGDASTITLFIQGVTHHVGIGLKPTVNMHGLSIEEGLLTLKERALPTADNNYGKIWTESDNTLHFQSGAGVEYTINITGV